MNNMEYNKKCDIILVRFLTGYKVSPYRNVQIARNAHPNILSFKTLIQR